ncbi:MAG: hypothetical protein PHT26_06800 [Lentimicrobiaceae bacterium]|jgi:uncharacterized lipoprotein|nr:hypothetical protein [Lentimicrobiaceae bacterium]
MKNQISAMAVLAVLLLSACNSNSKSKTWTADQEKQWKTECVQMLVDKGVTDAVAEDHCDCMYQKTSEAYTPTEAAALTLEQERKLWRECDYSW